MSTSSQSSPTLSGPAAQLLRWSAAGLIGWLALVALLVTWRRLAGALSCPLGPAAMTLVGASLAGVAVVARLARQRQRQQRWRRTRGDLLLSAAVLLLACALWVPGCGLRRTAGVLGHRRRRRGLGVGERASCRPAPARRAAGAGRNPPLADGSRPSDLAVAVANVAAIAVVAVAVVAGWVASIRLAEPAGRRRRRPGGGRFAATDAEPGRGRRSAALRMVAAAIGGRAAVRRRPRGVLSAVLADAGVVVGATGGSGGTGAHGPALAARRAVGLEACRRVVVRRQRAVAIRRLDGGRKCLELRGYP